MSVGWCMYVCDVWWPGVCTCVMSGGLVYVRV